MDNLGIDYKLIIAQLVNFGLFYIIFKKFIAKPFLNLIKEEEENDKKRDEIKVKLEKQDEEINFQREKLEKEIAKKEEEIILDAKERAKSIKENLIKESEVDASRIKEKALKEIDAEKQDLYKELKHRITELSLIIVNKTLKDILTSEMKKKITNSIIKNLPNEKISHEN
ncbi:MAG: hypothetical protein ABH812_03740 [bacterium]